MVLLHQKSGTCPQKSYITLSLRSRERGTSQDSSQGRLPCTRYAIFLFYSEWPLLTNLKLGHFGICSKIFDKQVEWYTQNFNLVPTDFLHVGEGDQRKNVATFMHIDRGEDL